MALSFIFDANQAQTPATVARQRAIVQALMESQRAPRNVGEGLNALGDGIVENVLNRRADAAERAGMASAQGDFNSAISGGGAFPPGSAASAAPSDGSSPSVDVSKTAAGSVDPQTIYAGLKARGLNDAQAYATLGNWKQESELNPGAVNPGEGAIGLDQWRLGRADALRQFAQQTGRSVNDPETQMDFYVNELKSHAGGQAFMAANDIPSANAALKTFIAYGSPYDKGGEGTRLANALAYQKLNYGGAGATPAASGANAAASGQTPPAQVASLDPSAGLPADAGAPDLPSQAPVPQGRPSPVTTVPTVPGSVPMSAAGQQLLIDPHSLSGPGSVVQALAAANPPAPSAQPSPVTQALAGSSQPQQAAPVSPGVQKVAQALQGGDPSLPAMAGGTSDVIQPGQDMTTPALMRALSNPWATPQQQQILGAMLSARITPHKIEMVPLGDGSTAEVDSITGRQVGTIKGIKPPVAMGYDQRLVDPMTGQQIGGNNTGQLPYRFMTTDEKQAAGLPLDTPIQIGPDGKMVSTGVTVNTGQPQSQYSDEMAKGLSGPHMALESGVEAAQEQLRDVHAMQAAVQQIKQNGGTTGMLQPEIMKLQSAVNSGANALGIDQPFDISDKEFLSKFNRQMAGAQAKSAAGARVTNFEMKNYLAANPGLEMSPQGIERLLGIQSQVLQRNIEVGQAIRSATASAVASGRKVNPAQIEQIIRDYDAGHHITDPITGQDLTQDVKLKDLQTPGANGASSAVRPRATNAQGQSVEWDGTNWVPVQ